MAFSRTVFVLLTLNVVFTYATVPVFMWGDMNGKSPKSNPLTTVSELEFEGILKRELKDDPFIVAFIDESLSVEDLSLKNDEGETVFPYLHANIGDSLYLPAVETPLESLQAIAKSKGNFIKVTDKGLSAEIEKQDDGILFISLKDAQMGESRDELLRRHNDLMEDMFPKFQEKYDKVVAIYTARYPSWIIPTHSIVRRQAQEETLTDSTSDYDVDGLRLYVGELVLVLNKVVTNLTKLSFSETYFNESENSMSTLMVFEATNLTLNFGQKFGYWNFESVGLETQNFKDELRGTSDVEAIVGFSYRCNGNVVFTNNATFSSNSTSQVAVMFKDMKVQPFFTSGSHQFGDAFNCVGFFSVPIWSGLMVVFILLSITFYGIMMMLDIRTMDRFDDPKGKTITINAGE